jgi:sugar lactone lactonase YvrE
MIKYFVVALLIAVGHEGFCQTDSLTYYYGRATKAYDARDVASFYKNIKRAHQLHPFHPTVLFLSARASALQKKEAESIGILHHLLYQKSNINLNHDDFREIREAEKFKELFILQNELSQNVINSDTAFVMTDPTAHIECIAAGEEKGIFYLGSINKRKIIRVVDGNAADFITQGQEGLTSVFGIKTDQGKKVLWACASPVREMENYDSLLRSAVYKFDLRSGKLLAKYETAERKEQIFGDLVLDPSGTAYVSDSQNNVIYVVNEKTGVLEKFFDSKEFWNIQGITFNRGGSLLYVADYVKGIYVLDVKTKNLTRMSESFELTTKSVDGLVYKANTLIALQNSIYPMRATQYLNSMFGINISGFKIIDRGHPAYPEPTIGCVVGNDFYYVANSAWGSYEKNHQLVSPEKLRAAVILKYDLTKLK